MTVSTSTNERIAKNTAALYFRTFITMVVGLYTGRVMLLALGVDNFGINSVVGGIVGMSSLLTGTMSQAISRYITYALGKGDKDRMCTVFSTSINAQIVMAFIVCTMLEIAGVWFLNYKANFPEGRLFAANCVLQFSILSFAISLISSPYNSLLIAHEKMKIYAYTSIFEALMKLGICFAVMAFGGDKLVFFAFLQIIVNLGMRFFYGWYCSHNFTEAQYIPKAFDKVLLKEISVFSSWNFLNNGAYVLATQGVSMLINVFFGVTFNAARAIASQVNQAVQNFVNNFTIAFSPQITKNYASGNVDFAIQLANKGTKFSWLMMYIFIVPVCSEADTLLSLWLGSVPDMAGFFLRFAMFESLAVTSGQNLYRLIQADGNIKHYTTRSFLIASIIFPLVWILYREGAPVWITYIVFIVDYIFLNLLRYYEIRRLMPFSVKEHFKVCIIPCLIVSVISFCVPLVINKIMEPGLLRLFINVPVSMLWTLSCCIVLGLTKQERLFLQDRILKFIVKYK